MADGDQFEMAGGGQFAWIFHFSADEEFTSFGRILKKYDGFLEEMAIKLRN